MELGLCGGDLARMPRAAEWGFDFVEIGARTVVPFEPAAAWREQQGRIRATGARITHLSGFVPKEVPFVGPDVDWVRFRTYVETVVVRASELGIRTYNWGSAAARMVPEGFSLATATLQMERAAHIVADVMERHDSVAAIEPINPGECNLLYYLTDAAAIARRVGRPAIGVNVDSYHLELQKEPFAHIQSTAPFIRHAHISGPGRAFPTADDGFDHRGFLAALHGIGFDEAIGFECHGMPAEIDYATAARAGVRYVRDLWRNVTSATST